MENSEKKIQKYWSFGQNWKKSLKIPIENEKIQVVNVNNGERLETYIIKGKRGSGIVCLNGPAARKGAVGDLVVIISYATMDFEAAKTFKPWVVFPKEGNKL